MILSGINLIIVLLTWKLSTVNCITNPGEPRYNHRSIRRQVSSATISDWEPGLREASYQALSREHHQSQNLQDEILHAPLEGRHEPAVPFGDITVLARGQLYSTPNGFRFVQDPHHNDCDDCHSRKTQCGKFLCGSRPPSDGEQILALWKVKRIRHRDADFGHRYDLEYTIAPISATINVDFRKPNGGFNYDIPGHVFIIRTNGFAEKAEYQQAEESTIRNNYLKLHQNNEAPHIPTKHEDHFRPGFLFGISPNGYRHVIHNFPATDNNINRFPTTSNSYQGERAHELGNSKEIEVYKALVDTLSKKTSTTAYKAEMNGNAHRDIFDINVPNRPQSSTIKMPQYIFETHQPLTTSTTAYFPTTSNAYYDIFDVKTSNTQQTPVGQRTTVPYITLPNLPTSTRGVPQKSEIIPAKVTTHIFDLDAPGQTSKKSNFATTPISEYVSNRAMTIPTIVFTGLSQPSANYEITAFQPIQTKTTQPYIPTETVPYITKSRQTLTTSPSVQFPKTPDKYSEPDPIYHSSSDTTSPISKAPVTRITFFTPTETNLEDDIFPNTSPGSTPFPSSSAKPTTQHNTADIDDIFIYTKTGVNNARINAPRTQLPKPEDHTETVLPYTQTAVTKNLDITTHPATYTPLHKGFLTTSTKKRPIGSTTYNINTAKTTKAETDASSTAVFSDGSSTATPIQITTSTIYSPVNFENTITYDSNTRSTEIDKKQTTKLFSTLTTKQASTRPRNTRKPFIIIAENTGFNSEESTSENTTPAVTRKYTYTKPYHTSTITNNDALTITVTETKSKPTTAATVKASLIDTKFKGSHSHEISKGRVQNNKSHEDKILFDIFGGSDDVIEKPTIVTSTSKHIKEDDDFLFGKPITRQPTNKEQTKVIFENFFEASTTTPTIKELETDNDGQFTMSTVDSLTTQHTKPPLKIKAQTVPRTSMSYITSISFEVNSKNKNNSLPVIPSAVSATTNEYEPMIKAKMSEMSSDDYHIFKAEMPDVQSSSVVTTESNTRNEFDKLALTVLNHARSIDILNSTKYKRRRRVKKRNKAYT